MILEGLRGRREKDFPLKQLTTWRIGGPAEWVYWPESVSDLIEARRRTVELGLPCRIIGRGSNLLAPDQGLEGLVLITTELKGITWGEHSVQVEAGYNIARLAQEAGERGWSGLEFARGIPGTVGGALVMNAGANGGELGPLVRRVRIVDFKGEDRILSQEQLRFGYRESSLKNEGWILEGELALKPGQKEEILEKMTRFMEQRKQGQPLDKPNAGSVFRNPPHDSAGRLIEGAGWKGRSLGGAQVSEKHANFIINRGGATASDILTLIEEIQRDVLTRYGVELHPEVHYLR